jgi:hypothetical protein
MRYSLRVFLITDYVQSSVPEGLFTVNDREQVF